MASTKSYFEAETDVDDLWEMLSLLEQHGLHAEVVDGESPRIIGGHSVMMMKGTEIPIYSHSFSISRELSGWLVSTDSEGQLVKDNFVSSMDEVVRVIESMRST